MKDENLFKIIENKIIFLLLPGSSIEELEIRIKNWEKYLNKICYAGMNYFNIIEDNILSKVIKHFDVVFDCSEVQYDLLYETKIRIPRFIEFLNRNEINRLITTHQIVNKMDGLMNDAVLNKWMDKITYIEP